MVEEMTYGMILFSFVLHHAIFRALPGRDDDACRAKSCYISHFHCTITIVSSVAYWFVNPVYLTSPEFMVNGPTGSQSEWMRLTVAYSIGYFANDLLLIILHPCVGGADMIAHHIIIGGFFFLGLIDRCCTPYHFLFMIEEISTPFLNLRWQYREKKEGTIYQFCQLMFAVTFFLSRILVGTGFVWLSGVRVLPGFIAAQPSLLRRVHLASQLAACTLSRGLNLFWFSKIVRIVARGGYTKRHVDESKLQ
uniref:TLC domain-containing protein n=1 Tax=Cryptomonas curvata TaxID=233186 RepID=A0A7S0QE03_9CRYP|mmetsp:Transcript_14747/g.31507  ORF Transcript_14747/g.31507 Transcript_14747/m.31507 type:complete len:250 (+) Transcript_14747:3-752(+)